MSQRKWTHVLDAKVCIRGLAVLLRNKDGASQSALCSTDASQKLGKSSSMYLGHSTGGFSRSVPSVGQGWEFGWVCFILMPKGSRDKGKSCKFLYPLIKNSLAESWAWHVKYIAFHLFLWQLTPNVCVYFCPPWRYCIFSRPGSSLCQAALFYFHWPSSPPHTFFSAVPLRCLYVHEILSMWSHKICYRRLMKKWKDMDCLNMTWKTDDTHLKAKPELNKKYTFILLSLVYFKSWPIAVSCYKSLNSLTIWRS